MLWKNVKKGYFMGNLGHFLHLILWGRLFIINTVTLGESDGLEHEINAERD